MLRPEFLKASGHFPNETEVGFFEDILGAILEERSDLKDIFPEQVNSTFFGNEAAPNFSKPMVYFPEQGMCARTLIIGDEVFKAQRNDNPEFDGLRKRNSDKKFKQMDLQMDLESNILRHLKNSGLPVPELTCEGKETVFFGMTRMKGVKLDYALIDKMTDQEKRQLAKDIAGFISGFEKAILPQDAKLLGFRDDALTASETKPEELKRALVDPDVVKALGDDMKFCRDMQKAFEKRYEEEYRNIPQVASHGDLHFGNILYDLEAKEMSAVIDFGLVGFRRPEGNFIRFSQECKDDFTSMICEEYSKESDNKVTLKDVRVSEVASLMGFLSHMLEVGNEKGVQHAKKRISELKKSLAPDPEKVALSQTPKKQQFTKGYSTLE